MPKARTRKPVDAALIARRVRGAWRELDALTEGRVDDLPGTLARRARELADELLAMGEECNLAPDLHTETYLNQSIELLRAVNLLACAVDAGGESEIEGPHWMGLPAYREALIEMVPIAMDLLEAEYSRREAKNNNGSVSEISDTPDAPTPQDVLKEVERNLFIIESLIEHIGDWNQPYVSHMIDVCNACSERIAEMGERVKAPGTGLDRIVSDSRTYSEAIALVAADPAKFASSAVFDLVRLWRENFDEHRPELDEPEEEAA